MRTARSLLGVATLAALLTPEVSAETQQGEVWDRAREVRFARPLRPEELTAMVGETGSEPLEIYYRSAAMTAGYTLAPGESVEAAFARMERKQREFLEAAIEQLGEAREATRDTVELRGYARLEGEFKAALKELDAGEFGIRAVKFGEALEEPVGTPGEARRQMTPDQNLQGGAREAWAPNRGTARVSRSLVFETFYFSSVTGFAPNTSYTHRTEIGNPAFANYGHYWASNMPEAFLDLQFGLTADVFGVGSTSPRTLRRNYEYFTHISLVSTVGSPTVSSVVRVRGMLGRTASGCHGWASCVLNPLAITRDLTVFQAPSVQPWIY